MSEELVVARQNFNLKLLTYWFLYTTFSGAVRKWVFTDALTGNIMLGIQIGVPLLFVFLAKTKPLSSFTGTLFAAYSLLLLLMAFNPLAQTLIHGTIGYFLHTGVFFPLLVYLNDREAFPVERLNRLFLIVILVEVVLGVAQFLAPSTSILNKYVRDTTEVGGIAMLNAVNRVRITGTFSYIGGMTSLFTMMGFVIWGFRLTRQSPIWIAALLICCGVVSPMTGSRGLSALLILLVGCAFLSTVKEMRNTVSLALLAGLTLIILQYSNFSLIGEAYTGLHERINAHGQDGENRSRVVGQIEEIVDFRGNYPLLGTGLGGTYQGAKALFGESQALQEYGFYEEEPERIILEGGFLLFFARLLIWWILFRRSTIPLFFSIILLYMHVFYQVTLFNVFTSFYTVIGIMYLDRCYWLRYQQEKIV